MYAYDIVVLDIMKRIRSSEGFCDERIPHGDAHGSRPVTEALKKAIKPGSRLLSAKEAIPNLRSHLEDVVLGAGKPVWKKLFQTNRRLL